MTIALMERIPNDMWGEVLSYLNPTELGPVAFVNKQCYRIATSDVLWAQYPGIPKEMRFQVRGIERIDQIEAVFKRFIVDRFVDGKVSCLHITFAHAPGAKMELIMGANVHPTFGPSYLEPVTDNYDAIREQRLQVNCSKEQMIVERYIVFHHDIRGENVVFVNLTSQQAARKTSKFYGQYRDARADLPKRWVYLAGHQLEGWYHTGLAPDCTEYHIYQTAIDRLNLPPTSPVKEESTLKAALSKIKELANTAASAFAGIAAGVIALQHFLG